MVSLTSTSTNICTSTFIRRVMSRSLLTSRDKTTFLDVEIHQCSLTSHLNRSDLRNLAPGNLGGSCANRPMGRAWAQRPAKRRASARAWMAQRNRARKAHCQPHPVLAPAHAGRSNRAILSSSSLYVAFASSMRSCLVGSSAFASFASSNCRRARSSFSCVTRLS